MENKSHAFAAGAFVLLLLAMLVAMAVWLTRDNTEQLQFEISSPFGVTGLQPQAGVRYKGVAIGRVLSIGLDAQTPGNVLLRIAVQDKAPISSNTFATLGFQGVTGLAFVQLDDDGDASAAKPLTAAPGQLARLPMRRGLMARLTEQGGNILTQLEQASQRINHLLAPDNQQAVLTALSQIGQAAGSLQQLAQHADQALKGPNGAPALDLPQLAARVDSSLKTMQDTAERLTTSAETVRSSAAEFKKVSLRMTEPGGTLDKIARGSDALSSSSQALNSTVFPRLGPTLDESQRTVRQFGRVADNLASHPQALIFGNGTAAPGPGEAGFAMPSVP